MNALPLAKSLSVLHSNHLKVLRRIVEILKVKKTFKVSEISSTSERQFVEKIVRDLHDFGYLRVVNKKEGRFTLNYDVAILEEALNLCELGKT